MAELLQIGVAFVDVIARSAQSDDVTLTWVVRDKDTDVGKLFTDFTNTRSLGADYQAMKALFYHDVSRFLILLHTETYELLLQQLLHTASKLLLQHWISRIRDPCEPIIRWWRRCSMMMSRDFSFSYRAIHTGYYYNYYCTLPTTTQLDCTDTRSLGADDQTMETLFYDDVSRFLILLYIETYELLLQQLLHSAPKLLLHHLTSWILDPWEPMVRRWRRFLLWCDKISHSPIDHTHEILLQLQLLQHNNNNNKSTVTTTLFCHDVSRFLILLHTETYELLLQLLHTTLSQLRQQQHQKLLDVVLSQCHQINQMFCYIQM